MTTAREIRLRLCARWNLSQGKPLKALFQKESVFSPGTPDPQMGWESPVKLKLEEQEIIATFAGHSVPKAVNHRIILPYFIFSFRWIWGTQDHPPRSPRTPSPLEGALWRCRLRGLSLQPPSPLSRRGPSATSRRDRAGHRTSEGRCQAGQGPTLWANPSTRGCSQTGLAEEQKVNPKNRLAAGQSRLSPWRSAESSLKAQGTAPQLCGLR